MDPNPYKFDASNSRWVVGNERPATVMTVTALLWGFSVMKYNRRFFRVDKNLVNFMAFTALSAPAAYSYSSFIFSSPEIEAGIINNRNEATI